MKVFLSGLMVGLLLGVCGEIVVRRIFNPPLPPSIANLWGRFPAPPQTEWLPDGRKMRLLADFIYIDPRYTAWIAPAGAEVDGASIPQFLWTALGGPFEGQYRNASIVHDVECVRKSKSWEEVHFMFYEACRCGGVPEPRAKVLYAGVYHGGPRWAFETRLRTETVAGPDGAPVTRDVTETITVPLAAASTLDEARLQKLQTHIETENPSLESLRQLDVGSL